MSVVYQKGQIALAEKEKVSQTGESGSFFLKSGGAFCASQPLLDSYRLPPGTCASFTQTGATADGTDGLSVIYIFLFFHNHGAICRR